MTDSLSILGKKWQLQQIPPREGQALSQRLGIPEIMGRIMASRGVLLEAAQAYLEPSLKDLPDPNNFIDMDRAVARLHTAVANNEQIAIFGDYDVDGSCGAAMLLRYLRTFGLEPLLYIPDRLSEGYGPNPTAMERLKEKGAELVITVDCGCLAYEAMDRAAELGLDVIITDHHQGAPKVPQSVAMVNPNRVDETSEHGNLSGTGVAFLMLIALNRSLREDGFFTADKPEPDLRYLLDLVAVATVCDVVPLHGVNRVLVDRGLKVLATRRNPGLKALADVAGVDQKPGTYHAGFMIGPRINAGGRISACDLGARLLSTENPAEAERLAYQLDELNQERKEIEQDVLSEALKMAEDGFTEQTGALVLAGQNWHPGVIGIVASRVKEAFHRPVFIVSLDGDTCKGSGRSITGIDLGNIVINSKDILLGGGGHKMAAGVSLTEDNIEPFRQRLNELALKQAEKVPGIFTPTLKLDGHLRPGAANLSFLNKLEQLAPFGVGNPEPRFVFSDVKVQGAKVVGEKHLRLTITDADGSRVNGIAFRAMETPLGKFLMESGGKPVSISGQLRRNVWQGYESVQLQVEDAFNGSWNGDEA